jgi:hypothetical protein
MNIHKDVPQQNTQQMLQILFYPAEILIVHGLNKEVLGTGKRQT